MRPSPFAVLLLRSIAVTSVLWLPGCAWLESPTLKKPVTKVSKQKKQAPQESVDAARYVENLSVARVDLARQPADMNGISEELTTLKNYHSQKITKPVAVTLAVMDYSGKDQPARQVIAPISLTNRQFPALDKVLGHMSGMLAPLQTIRVARVAVAPDDSYMPKEEPLALAAALEEEQKKLVARASALKPAEDIMTQLALMEFFTEYRFQDAAYLTLENVKRLLATSTQEETLDDESLQTLSTKLQGMESTLKKVMPYTF